MSLFAHLEPETESSSERRSSKRRRLKLQAAGTAASGTKVVIHDLSEKGMLLESGSALLVGDQIELCIPEAGTARATIIWHSGRYFGCRFDEPLSSASVSAALLRSPATPSDEERSRALYNALAELRALGRVIEEITDRVDATIEGLKARRPR